jgi:hypothetical protein
MNLTDYEPRDPDLGYFVSIRFGLFYFYNGSIFYVLVSCHINFDYHSPSRYLSSYLCNRPWRPIGL